MHFDTLGGAISWCTDSFHVDRTVYSPEEVVEARNSVTIKQLKLRIREVFVKENYSCIGLGPVDTKIFKEIAQTIFA